MDFEELLKHSLKRDLTAADLNTRLGFILKDYPEHASKLVHYFNIRTVKELLEIDFKDLVVEEINGNISGLKSIRNCCHNFGFLLKGEYSDLDISDEEALLPITAFDISRRCKNSLLRSGKVQCLGDLLSLNSSSLINMRNLGIKGIKEICDCLSSFGYSLDYHDDSIDKKKQQLLEKGEFLVDDVIDSRKVNFALNRAGIYSIEQLLAVEDIKDIPGIGNAYSLIIFDSLKQFSFARCEENINSGNEVLDSLIATRDRLRSRKIELLLEQAEIDSKLSEINKSIDKFNVGVSYDKKKN